MTGGEALPVGTTVRIPKGTVVRVHAAGNAHGATRTTGRVQTVVVSDSEPGIVRWVGMANRVMQADRWEVVGPSAALHDQELADLHERLERVMALHRFRRTSTDGFTAVTCVECLQDWPCPTYAAAEGE